MPRAKTPEAEVLRRARISAAGTGRKYSAEARRNMGLSHIKTHCKRGHELAPPNLYIRSSGGRHCRECMRLQDRARHVRDRDKRNATKNAYWHALPEATRKARNLRRFNLSVEQYAELLESQDSRCAICRSDQPDGKFGKAFAVDHDRACCPGNKSCGKCVRGLLCQHCNVLLGNSKENIGTLTAAIAYLQAAKSA